MVYLNDVIDDVCHDAGDVPEQHDLCGVYGLNAQPYADGFDDVHLYATRDVRGAAGYARQQEAEKGCCGRVNCHQFVPEQVAEQAGGRIVVQQANFLTLSRHWGDLRHNYSGRWHNTTQQDNTFS